MDVEVSQDDRRERLNDQEVNQGEDGGENVVLPPPPPPIELAQVLAHQTVLMEAIFNAVNRPRPRVLAQKVHSTPITQQAEQSWLRTRREQMTCQSIFPEN
jgi:hypothetical protein